MLNGNVKLGDFGIAKVLAHTMANAVTMVGTPYYLSPEIVQNRPYGFQSDIWSLGVLLYEMCALRPPFDATSIHALALKIIEGRYPPLGSRYSSELKQLVASMLMREPTSRPSIHQILKVPIIRRRIEDNLSRTLCMEEFSHTVLHGLAILDQPKPGPQQPTPVEARVQSSQGSREARGSKPQPSRVEPAPVRVPPNVREVRQDPRLPQSRYPAREPVRDPVRDPVREPVRDPVRDPARDYRPSDPRADYGRQAEYRPAMDYRPSDPNANYRPQFEYQRPAEYRENRPAYQDYRQPEYPRGEFQAIARPPPAARTPPAESRNPTTPSKPVARPPVSFFVPLEDAPEPPPRGQPTEADRYIARIQDSSNREDERRAMLLDLKQRRAALQNKRGERRNPDIDEYEAYIYEMQAALLEQEGDEAEVEQLQTPAAPVDREDSELSEDSQLQATSDLGRAEKLRLRLERDLGENIFLNAYRVVADLEETRRLNSVSEFYFYLKNLMTREEQETYVPLIRQLISLENR